MASKLAERLLKQRSPVLVDLSQGLIPAPDQKKQGTAAACKRRQQAEAALALGRGWGCK